MDADVSEGHQAGQELRARLARMVAAGRVTTEEAQRVRDAQTDDERAAAIRTIQVRHARERLATAVAAGELTAAEADAACQSLDGGGDLHEVRQLLARTARHRAPDG